MSQYLAKMVALLLMLALGPAPVVNAHLVGFSAGCCSSTGAVESDTVTAAASTDDDAPKSCCASKKNASSKPAIQKLVAKKSCCCASASGSCCKKACCQTKPVAVASCCRNSLAQSKSERDECNKVSPELAEVPCTCQAAPALPIAPLPNEGRERTNTKVDLVTSSPIGAVLSTRPTATCHLLPSAAVESVAGLSLRRMLCIWIV
ncbi:MAG: hypothetical protein SGJ20_02790 [Planctomycetota bacterium]|nr:hypothetical protein [Planctomycetota bacterium]